jgi:hypothetical protein
LLGLDELQDVTLARSEHVNMLTLKASLRKRKR